MLFIKQKGNRYYREDRFSMRSFPIAKAEVEKLITEGKAEMVDNFIFDFSDMKQEQQEQTLNNIIDITARIKENKEQQELEKHLNKFKNDYLPNFTKEDLQTLLNTDQNHFGEELTKICWRIDIEKRL